MPLEIQILQNIGIQNTGAVTVQLSEGAAEAEFHTCDFSYDYVKINADYRS